MPRFVKLCLLVGAVLAACLAVWWLAGDLLRPLADWAAQEQREFQNRMARALRALRGGQPGALAILLSACFAYGFFHAVGPGHGKVLIGGYGLGRAVPWARLSLLALLSSLGQAVTAVLLVYGAVFLLQLGRDSMVEVAERTMAPISYGAIVAIGIWLLVRGLRRLVKQGQSQDGANRSPHVGHDHGHSHPPQGDPNAAVCDHCGHRHGPTVEEVGQVSSWKEAFVLIAGIAVRPCTGALFVLVITWQMGIPLAGIAGAFTMALGTAAVTILVGLAALGMRGGTLRLIAEGGRGRQVVPLLEVSAGFIVALVAAGLLVTSLR